MEFANALPAFKGGSFYKREGVGVRGRDEGRGEVQKEGVEGGEGAGVREGMGHRLSPDETQK